MRPRWTVAFTVCALTACGPPAGVHEIPRFGRGCKPGLTLRCGGRQHVCTCEVACDRDAQCPSGFHCMLRPPPDGIANICEHDVPARVACDAASPAYDTALPPLPACRAPYTAPFDAGGDVTAVRVQALASLKRGEAELAVCMFAAALALQPDGQGHLLLATALFEARRYREARAHIAAYFERVQIEPYRDVGSAEELNDWIYWAVVRVRVAAIGPREVHVRVDGAEPSCPMSAEIELDPGEHVFELSAEGYATVRRAMTFRRGDRGEVRVKMERR